MKVSIIIPTKNAGIMLKRFLEEVRRQICDYEIELIVVDSGSSDDTLNIAKSYNSKIVVIPSKFFSHGGARNLGASISNGDYLVFCNQDILPANAYWLNNLLAPLKSFDVAASYSRQVAPPNAHLHERVFLSHVYPPHNRMNSHELLINRGPLEIVLFSTVSGAIKRDVWKKFKFNEKIIMSEDYEFACRILMSGYKIAYVSDSIIYHANFYSLSTAFKRYFDCGYSISCTHFNIIRMDKSIRFIIKQIQEILRDSNSKLFERLFGIVYIFMKMFGYTLGQFGSYYPEYIRAKLSLTRSLIK